MKKNISNAASSVYRLVMKNFFTKLFTLFIVAPVLGGSLGTAGYFSFQGIFGNSANAAQVQVKMEPKPVEVVEVEETEEQLPAKAYDTKLVSMLQKELKGRTVNFTARDGYLETMNEIADAMRMPVITESNLDSLKECGFLVPASSYLKEKGVEDNLAFCTAPLNVFLENLSIEFSDKFGKRLTLNSAVRTVEKQKKLAKKNKNAARENGSMHTRGCAADISYKGLSVKEITWLQAKFKALDDPKIWVIKERLGYYNFHIVVFS